MSSQQKLTKYDIRLFGLMAACVGLVFVLPESRSTEPAFVNGLIWLMTSIIPSINQWAEGSKFPELTRLYLSILWLITPVMSWLLLKNADVQPKQKYQRPNSERFAEGRGAVPAIRRQDQSRRTTSKPVLILAGVIFFPLMIAVVLVPIFDGFPINERDYHSHSLDAFVTLAPRQSVFWMGVLGTAACGGVAFGLAAISMLFGNCIFYIRFKFSSFFRKQ